ARYSAPDSVERDALASSTTQCAATPKSQARMDPMKVGIVGAGAVGTACMFALALRGSAREIVLVNRNCKRARGAVADLRYGAVLAPHVSLRAGDYNDLSGAAIVMITAGA